MFEVTFGNKTSHQLIRLILWIFVSDDVTVSKLLETLTIEYRVSLRKKQLEMAFLSFINHPL